MGHIGHAMALARHRRLRGFGDGLLDSTLSDPTAGLSLAPSGSGDTASMYVPSGGSDPFGIGALAPPSFTTGSSSGSVGSTSGGPSGSNIGPTQGGGGSWITGIGQAAGGLLTGLFGTKPTIAPKPVTGMGAGSYLAIGGAVLGAVVLTGVFFKSRRPAVAGYGRHRRRRRR